MSFIHDPMFLRRILVADAVISGATGLLMVAGAGTLHALLGVPAALLTWAGLALFPFAAAVLYLARREALPREGVLAVVAANALWVAGSLALLVTDLVVPTMLGTAFIAIQAFAVAAFAEMQYMGLRVLR
jgi:hypothetical protein